jgi:hypothetical protein
MCNDSLISECSLGRGSVQGLGPGAQQLMIFLSRSCLPDSKWVHVGTSLISGYAPSKDYDTALHTSPLFRGCESPVTPSKPWKVLLKNLSYQIVASCANNPLNDAYPLSSCCANQARMMV